MSETKLKILILGGYGTFGGRLAELLCTETALTLIIAGRSETKAADFCAKLGPGAERIPQAVDRDGDLGSQLAEIAPDILVDATGPFQAYGDDPYRVVKASIAAGIHYADLADGSEFVRGISQFDADAKARGVFVLSGVSSFPVLTAAVVRHLSKDLAQVESVIGGIAPSPYAGVGLNVIRAIAGYAGQKLSIRRDGKESDAYPLTETRRYTIAPPGLVPLNPIEFSLVDVPDLHLLADLWPDVQSVWIGAGPVPAVLHRMLRVLAWTVRWRLLPSLSPFASLMFHTINVLRWGEHRGGMFVEISGRNTDGEAETRSWHLLAEGDDGPLIPSMAVAAIVRNCLHGRPPDAGARAATGELEVADYDSLFAERAIQSGCRRPQKDGQSSLYRRLLGDAWDDLPATVKAMHRPDTAQIVVGQATVSAATGVLARIVRTVFRFPKPTAETSIAVSFQRSAERETWKRNFGGRIMRSTQFEGRGRFERLLCERFGPFVFGMAVVTGPDRLKLVVRRWSFLGIPLPKVLAPRGDSFEFERDGRFNFHVEIVVPGIGLIVKYTGYLEDV